MTGGEKLVDIEEELREVQIKYIQKSMIQLKDYYDELIDIEFVQLLCSYKEMIERATESTDKLELYKQMYQQALILLFEEEQDNEKVEFEDVDESIDKEGKLPF